MREGNVTLKELGNSQGIEAFNITADFSFMFLTTKNEKWRLQIWYLVADLVYTS